MLIKKEIGWQKYENVIEDQFNSPVFKIISKSLESQRVAQDFEESDSYSNDEEYDAQGFILGVPEDITNEISLTSNFDCWIGHTNFDITPNIRENLNKIRGVEVLKICSRYRFFIGVGKMFNFTNVRQHIEGLLFQLFHYSY